MSATEVVVAHPGEDLPHSWHASLLLADVSGRWHAALTAIRSRWAGPGRLVVFVPVAAGDAPSELDWLAERAAQADVTLFWLDEAGRAPTATTCFLFGSLEAAGRVVLGAADQAAPFSGRAAGRRIPVAASLPATISLAFDQIGDGAHRSGAHRDVPLCLWRTGSFRRWLAAKEDAGHRLEGVHLAWNLRPKANAGVFLWVAHPRLHIGDEDRPKHNEVVIGRTDVVSVLGYYPGHGPSDSEVVMVREFRSPASTADGYVHELPCGGSLSEEPLADLAAREFTEETGMPLDSGRLRYHGSRQPLGTLVAHRQHLFSAELTHDEIVGLKQETGTFGIAEDGERTTVHVYRYEEIVAGPLVDWTTLGLLSAAFADIFTRPGVSGGPAG